MAYTEVISVAKAEQLMEEMANFEGRVFKSLEDLSYTIQAFESEEVVQSFVASGKVGSDTSKKLEDIRTAMEKYISQTINPLIQSSRSFLNDIISVSSSNIY